MLLAFSSCNFFDGKRIKGDGNVITETRSVGNFDGIEVSGAFDIYITQDNSYTVKVETDDNLQGYVITEVQGNELRIRPENHVNLRPTRMKIYVSAPVFKSLEASGACNIYSQNKLSSSEKMDIELSGSSDVVLDINAPEVEASLSGAGSVELKGETKELNIDGSGSSDIRCFDMKADNVSIDISGAGSAEVFANTKLDVEVSGSGDIKYKGSPSVQQRISGAGSVKKVD